MKTRDKGFSLIELMIVIAIIGILAAVAVPSYQSYVQKSHFAEIFSAASAAETAVAEYVMSNGGPNSANCVNVVFSYPATATVSQVVIQPDTSCLITVYGVQSTFGSSNPPYFYFTPGNDSTGSIQWGCSTKSVNNVPSTCQPLPSSATAFTAGGSGGAAG